MSNAGTWSEVVSAGQAPEPELGQEHTVRRIPHREEGARVDGLSEQVARRLQRLRWLADLMDNSIQLPGIGVRVGLDPIVGVVPVLGDVITSCVSAYIVWEAHKLGARRSTIAKMSLNVVIDLVVGEIPALGDVFDFAFKANRRNISLLEEDMQHRA